MNTILSPSNSNKNSFVFLTFKKFDISFYLLKKSFISSYYVLYYTYFESLCIDHRILYDFLKIFFIDMKFIYRNNIAMKTDYSEHFQYEQRLWVFNIRQLPLDLNLNWKFQLVSITSKRYLNWYTYVCMYNMTNYWRLSHVYIQYFNKNKYNKLLLSLYNIFSYINTDFFDVSCKNIFIPNIYILYHGSFSCIYLIIIFSWSFSSFNNY